ncbi:flagellar basal body P-ring formation protein FlgA [Paracoccus sp. S-4012]|uniref:flagellar basal body P-ring formation chaperone FlgA n=1 Tax=Paracoccus sp. S-4012 TaxID=2665648 RepID=UPI0012B05E7C|nr:flagellar basal body P-ring formation chaperone FlgA [Paracoccus sp. S-4012]MRX49244.1 flagellar basal body P-ring formation protein FlgA [Paracoccus sp. S-4012]
MRALALMLAVAVPPTAADALAVTARHALPAGTVLSAQDVALDLRLEGGLSDPREAIGRQLRHAVHAGRPIAAVSLTAPVLVERNQLVTLIWSGAGLSISTEGRALGRGAAGETIRVLNTASRVTVAATIQPDGTLAVGMTP